ncbi:MAG: FtsW/RodA/SpoVE family cell cycle protein [Peptostreptococcaceae bacterium]|nr:FtsW/RodA/SpoVE family cell cycle protein [Peptostreptococcaceae bacterium]MDY5739372.1 FtsW/RodA/SpoVE family cell cycle protein [Anaerovoracaceae bacterium]SFE21170.1 cell division protein FtsW, lipid II flippase [Peptostreptococcaceae bacterium pGA-8]
MISNFFEAIGGFFQEAFKNMRDLTQLENGGEILYTAVARWVFIFLALFILIRMILSLLSCKNPSEVWAYFHIDKGEDSYSIPITHWENVIGRGKSSDLRIEDRAVSRSHGTISRNNDGDWEYMDFGSTNGALINGNPTKAFVSEPIEPGDIITVGRTDCTIFPISVEEKNNNIKLRKEDTRFTSPWSTLIAITLFQIGALVQLKIALAEAFVSGIVVGFMGLSAIMWAYVIFMKTLRRKGLEMELIAFFLSTLSLAVTASKYPDAVFKQFIAIALGVGIFFVMCTLLRNLERTQDLRKFMLAAAVLLFLVNLAIARTKFGAANWIQIGGVSLQPSEIVKLAYIWVGSATLNNLMNKKDNLIFMLFSGFCFGCLALMGDFGTAMIFFVSFLIISFLRTGDFTRLIVVVGIAGVGGLMVLKFKAYVAQRFATWLHVWDYADTAGFQQTRGLTAAASGGLVGVGAGKGWLSEIPASDTDLVFPLMIEEWGLIIAVLAILAIITLSIFAVRSILAGRSTFYTIAACSAMSMFIFQTALNVFGATDILPFTGVTFPFLSNGGTSMIASWGLLAFLKSADTRQNASFAISLSNKGLYIDGGEA